MITQFFLKVLMYVIVFAPLLLIIALSWYNSIFIVIFTIWFLIGLVIDRRKCYENEN